VLDGVGRGERRLPDPTAASTVRSAILQEFRGNHHDVTVACSLMDGAPRRMKHLTCHCSHLALAAMSVCAVGLHLGGTIGVLVGATIGGALCWLAPLAETRTDLRSIPDDVSRGVVVAKVSGALTFLARGTILRRLDGAAWPRVLVLDLTAVPMVDAGGVTEIAEVVEFLAARNARVVVAASEALHARLRVCAPIFGSVDDAIRSVKGPARVDETPALPFAARAASWS
jgi:MFS superfamily sulfate permease-like transporter